MYNNTIGIHYCFVIIIIIIILTYQVLVFTPFLLLWALTKYRYEYTIPLMVPWSHGLMVSWVGRYL